MELSLPLKVIIAVLIGAAIGLEREWHKNDIPGISDKQPDASIGVRTISLITLLGAVAGTMLPENNGLFLIISIALTVLILAFYILSSWTNKDFGITTEIALIFSYTIGVLLTTNIIPVPLILAVSVILLLILSRKEKIKNVVSTIKRTELNAFISYAIIALVILPFLPNQSITLNSLPLVNQFAQAANFNLGQFGAIEILNPFSLWMVVALITGVDLIGYALSKIIGRAKGYLVTSIIGGFISSTATTQSLAQESKTARTVSYLVAAAVFANLASFLQHIILIAPINAEFLVASMPVIIMMIAGALAAGIFFLFRTKTQPQAESVATNPEIEDKEIFSIGPALNFALLFLVIKLITKVSLIIFGNNGFILTSAIASITGVDAVTINTAELVGKTISVQTGVATFIMVNVVNLISKALYSFAQGKREFALQFAYSVGLISFAGVIAYLFL